MTYGTATRSKSHDSWKFLFHNIYFRVPTCGNWWLHLAYRKYLSCLSADDRKLGSSTSNRVLFSNKPHNKTHSLSFYAGIGRISFAKVSEIRNVNDLIFSLKSIPAVFLVTFLKSRIKSWVFRDWMYHRGSTGGVLESIYSLRGCSEFRKRTLVGGSRPINTHGVNIESPMFGRIELGQACQRIRSSDVNPLLK